MYFELYILKNNSRFINIFWILHKHINMLEIIRVCSGERKKRERNEQ